MSHSGSAAGSSLAPRLAVTPRSPGRWGYLLVLAAAASAAWLPSILGPYDVGLATRFMIFGIIALSLDLLWGYAGVVSFGHAVFFGIGVYAMAITLVHFSGLGGTYLALLLAVVAPMVLAAVLGYFLFFARVSGVYFGIVTLALSVIFETLAIVSRPFTGGLDGLYNFSIPKIGIPGVGRIEVWGTNNPFYAAVVGLALCFILARALVRSPFGIVLRAMRDDEERLEMLGYHTALLKTFLLIVTCGMAGFAGALYTSVGFVSPELLGIFFSTQVLIWVGVGGRGTLWGPVIGAIAVGYLETTLSGRYQNIWPLLVGVFFLLIVLFWPGGILGLGERALALVAPRRQPAGSAAGGTSAPV